jgi:hypothetical protein
MILDGNICDNLDQRLAQAMHSNQAIQEQVVPEQVFI